VGGTVNGAKGVTDGGFATAARVATRSGRRDVRALDEARPTGAPPRTARAGTAAAQDMAMGGPAGCNRRNARPCARGSGDHRAMRQISVLQKPRETFGCVAEPP
jgi:hypothetical protein